jgi:hypothetical protein
MRSQVRSGIGLLGAAVVIAAMLTLYWVIHSSKNPVNTAIIWTGYFGAAALAVPLLTLSVTWWVKNRGGTAVATGTLAQVTASADWLAEAVAARWRREAADRRIVTPAPATVRWRWADAELTAPRQELMSPPVSGTGPAPLPDLVRPGEVLGSGVVTRLHDEVYARLPHGRLVLIGGPGAGKTGAMILLLLAALHKRASLSSDQRGRIPVPVWLTLGGWNPVGTSLREWAAETMNRDYPALRAPDYGAAAAGELVRSGRVALFLDGLDEMPPDIRALALRRVNDEARDLRVVITSRPQEWELALHGTVPEHTAVIELRPVRPEAAAAYLLHEQPMPSRERWEQVGAYLRNNPDSVAAGALDNPLTLSLARDAYVSQDPVVLTDPDRFPSADAIREHLIDQFLVTVYPGQRQREDAISWLAWIAWHMGSSQDLQWWAIPGWVPPWQLRLVRGLGIGLVAGLSVLIAAGLSYAHTRGLAGGFSFALGPCLAAVVGTGLIAGLVTRLGIRPAAVAGTSAPPQGLGTKWIGRAFIPGLTLWFALCLAVMLALAFTDGRLAVEDGFQVVFWSACMAMLAFEAARRRARRVPQPGRRPPLDRPFVRGTIAALTAGTGAGLWAGLAAGPVTGLGAAILGSTFGILFGIVFRLWGERGFGLTGAPQVLVPRWPRPRWLLPLWLPLFPLLTPVILNQWATPVADSPWATAARSYRADRRTSMIYAFVYALALGISAGLIAGLDRPSESFTNTGRLMLGLGWALVAGIVTWLMAWLAAGQVSLVTLTQLALIRRRGGRVHFARLLADASDRQVLRQAGAVYQFRHAELQAHLAKMHQEPATRYAMSEAMPADTASSARSGRGDSPRIPLVICGIAIVVGLTITITAPVKPMPRPELTEQQLRSGDCLRGSNLDLGGGTWPALVAAVPCTQQHLGEVFFAGNAWPESKTYSGNDATTSQAYKRCLAAFTTYVGTDPADSALLFAYVRPGNAADWATGDRLVVCVAYMPGVSLNYSIKGSHL